MGIIWTREGTQKMIHSNGSTVIELPDTTSGIPLVLVSWPENQGILFFIYFSNTSNEPDIFHGCTS